MTKRSALAVIFAIPFLFKGFYLLHFGQELTGLIWIGSGFFASTILLMILQVKLQKKQPLK